VAQEVAAVARQWHGKNVSTAMNKHMGTEKKVVE
jgi:hypothetical protein